MHTSIENSSVKNCMPLPALIIAVFLVTGCVSPRSVLYTEGPTMKEVLQGAKTDRLPPAGQQESDNTQSAMRLSAHVNPREVVRYDAFTRDSLNEITQLFPKLRNPTFALYVDPHLATSSRAPVPGYTTEFSLYERDEYALPEEVPPNRYPSSSDLTGRVQETAKTTKPFEPGAIVEETVQ